MIRNHAAARRVLRLATATSVLCLCLAMAPATVAAAADAAPVAFNIPAQSLVSALQAFSAGTGIDVIGDTQPIRARTSQPVVGTFAPERALQMLLAGTGLQVERVSEHTIRILPPDRGSQLAPVPSLAPVRPVSGRLTAPEPLPEEIVVTGSRIRGAVPASPVIARTERQMLDAGQTTLTEALRSIPQNFGGGQNPGIGQNVPEASGNSSGSAASINLRGLGPDATLTLLNGHRLAYNFAFQAVDVSAIPFGAVDRIEIVADGASALYGSDAVSGVANIVLKRDFDGIATNARFGASTDGGNEQQQYSVVGGRRWDGGGVIVAVEKSRTTQLEARHRDYTALRAPGLFLYPFMQYENALFSGHQELAPGLTFELDAMYNNRDSHTQFALDSRGDIFANGAVYGYFSKSMVVAPTLRLALGDWRSALTGSYGKDRSRYAVDIYSNFQPGIQQRGCYCNDASSAEFNADGPLFALPGGDAKAAFGGGYRESNFHGYRTVGTAQDLRATQETWYGFGELNLPVLSRQNGIRWVERLNFSAALRYERFPGIGQIAAPKLGVVWAPTSEIEFKGSWGKSFRAPTLYQQYNLQVATVRAAQAVGGAGYPASATALFISGGNPNLKPERATSWSTTMAFQPAAIEGAKLEVSYFDIKYRDRIVTPILFSSQSLSNPAYTDMVQLAPSRAQLAAATAGVATLQTTLPIPYDPATVVALVDNTSRNAASQAARGFDISAEYRMELGGGDALAFNGSASYLHVTQRLSRLQASLPRAGVIFTPPHFRARAGVVWNAGNVTLAGYGNYTGGLKDTRTTPVLHVGSMTTFDATAGYRTEAGSSVFGDGEVSLSVQNLLNEKPPLIRATQAYEAPYDSTNFSAFGRFVALRLTKKW